MRVDRGVRKGWWWFVVPKVWGVDGGLYASVEGVGGLDIAMQGVRGVVQGVAGLHATMQRDGERGDHMS